MKKIIKNNYKNIYKKMDLLKDFNFFMIYIIHKMLALLKNHLNFLKDSILLYEIIRKYKKLLYL